MARYSILLVDDEANVVKALKRQFIDTDYKIYSATSAEEGLEVLAKKEIALVISDYRMPGLNGVQFLAKVKEDHPQTIRIILSGYADVAAVVEAINDGQIYKFIAKPWNEQELLTAIQRSLEHYELEKENAALVNELQTANEELRGLTDNLQSKVEERTRDLELKNRALKVAQRLLHLLPAGVVGIDSEGTLVYMNQAMNQYMDLSPLMLGENLGDMLNSPPLSCLKEAIDNKSVTVETFEERGGMRVVGSPLPREAGVVGLFTFADLERHRPISRRDKKPKQEVVNAG